MATLLAQHANAQWSCLNYLGNNDGTTCDDFDDGTSCVVSGIGYVDIDISDPTLCTSSTSNCPVSGCASTDDVSSSIRVCYRATSPYTGAARYVMVCRQWQECSSGPVSGCSDCTIITLTPGYFAPDCKTFDASGGLPGPLTCAAPGTGTYQMFAWAFDMDGLAGSCTCPNACTNGCPTNCSGSFSGVTSCCLDL